MDGGGVIADAYLERVVADAGLPAPCHAVVLVDGPAWAVAQCDEEFGALFPFGPPADLVVLAHLAPRSPRDLAIWARRACRASTARWVAFYRLADRRLEVLPARSLWSWELRSRFRDLLVAWRAPYRRGWGRLGVRACRFFS